MNFDISENQKIIIDSVKSFAQSHILPHVMDWDEKQIFPKQVFHEMGKAGLMGVLVSEKYGGSGLNYLEYISIIDEISQVDPSIGLSLAAHNSLTTNHLYSFGNEEQKQKYLPHLAKGEWIGVWGLTEHNSGSDAGGMNTFAKKDGNNWIINGSKNFITHGISGDLIILLARTGEKNTKNNSTAFIIEKGTAGFSSGKKENKLGMRASETAEMIFQDCIISDKNRLGEVGEGFKQALTILDGGRISIAALSIGIAKGAYQAAKKYSKEREQFGKPISDFQAISFKLANMATEISAAELLTQKAAYLKMKGKPMSLEGAMAKYYASEACVRISNDAVQIFGGYGYTKDFPVEKFYRDSKLCTIGEGTSEIQQLVISRHILRE